MLVTREVAMGNRIDDTDIDRQRMRYYLKEMRDKFARYPDSLVLRNGIAAIEDRLGMPRTVEPVDPLSVLPDVTEIAPD